MKKLLLITTIAAGALLSGCASNSGSWASMDNGALATGFDANRTSHQSAYSYYGDNRYYGDNYYGDSRDARYRDDRRAANPYRY